MQHLRFGKEREPSSPPRVHTAPSPMMKSLTLFLLQPAWVSAMRQSGAPLCTRRSALQLGAASAAFSLSPRAGAYTLDIDSKPPVQSSAALDELPRNTVIAYQRTWPAMQLAVIEDADRTYEFEWTRHGASSLRLAMVIPTFDMSCAYRHRPTRTPSSSLSGSRPQDGGT